MSRSFDRIASGVTFVALTGTQVEFVPRASAHIHPSDDTPRQRRRTLVGDDRRRRASAGTTSVVSRCASPAVLAALGRRRPRRSATSGMGVRVDTRTRPPARTAPIARRGAYGAAEHHGGAVRLRRRCTRTAEGLRAGRGRRRSTASRTGARRRPARRGRPRRFAVADLSGRRRRCATHLVGETTPGRPHRRRSGLEKARRVARPPERRLLRADEQDPRRDAVISSRGAARPVASGLRPTTNFGHLSLSRAHSLAAAAP